MCMRHEMKEILIRNPCLIVRTAKYSAQHSRIRNADLPATFTTNA